MISIFSLVLSFSIFSFYDVSVYCYYRRYVGWKGDSNAVRALADNVHSIRDRNVWDELSVIYSKSNK